MRNGNAQSNIIFALLSLLTLVCLDAVISLNSESREMLSTILSLKTFYHQPPCNQGAIDNYSIIKYSIEY